MSCHEKGGAVENSRGKMNCSGCHSLKFKDHYAAKETLIKFSDIHRAIV
jgi:hypothetical protein